MYLGWKPPKGDVAALVMEKLEEVRGQSTTVYATKCGFLATICLVLLRFFYTDGQMSQF